jgi:hypothetical protein
MTKASLLRTTFDWGWLTGAEVQSIIIKVGTGESPGRYDAGGVESFTLHLKAARRILTSRQLGWGS